MAPLTGHAGRPQLANQLNLTSSNKEIRLAHRTAGGLHENKSNHVEHNSESWRGFFERRHPRLGKAFVPERAGSGVGRLLAILIRKTI
jgi:hypothetical protein